MFNFFKKSQSFSCKLNDSSIFNEQNYINVVDIKKMLLGFNDKEKEACTLQTQQVLERADYFFQLIPKDPKIKIKLKILIACHILIDDQILGSNFAQKFIRWEGFNYNQGEKINELVELNQLYQLYLSKICHQYEIMKISRQKSFPSIYCKKIIQLLSDHQRLKPTQFIIFHPSISLISFLQTFRQEYLKILFKIKNLDEFVQRNKQVEFSQIFYEVYLLMWNDCIALYLYIENIVLQFIDKYYNISLDDFSVYYEITQDFQKLFKKINKFHSIQLTFNSEYQVKQPKWKIIDKEQISEIEIYHQNLKLSSNRKQNNQKDINTSRHFKTTRMSNEIPYQSNKANFHTSRKFDSIHVPVHTTLDYAKNLINSLSPTDFFLKEEEDFRQNRTRNSRLFGNQQI